MKNTGKRILALVLAICLIAGYIPVHLKVEAEAVSGVNSLTCASFISNSTRRSYIDTMMKYYINNYSSLQTTLNNGKSVVFMFEGGSDNYDSYEYVDAEWSTRLQAVCIVVQLNSSGNAEIVFYSENCSSIPDDANFVTKGYETSGSTTILDGIYGFQTCNHNGNYAAFNTYCETGWYTPYDGTTGYSGYCNGINIHTRSGSYCAGQNAGWCNSAGCQVIGYGASSSNEFNQFMKTVAGISFNAYDGTQRTMSSGLWVEKGYYVVDRQLGLLSPGGTEYGSGSLAELYTTGDLNGITAFSTSAANAAGALNFDYATSQCTFYPAHCQIKVTLDGAPVNSQPCSIGTTDDTETLESAALNKTYTATGLFQNGYGNYWYRVITSSGETGYIYGGEAEYVKQLTSDITLSGADTPNGHVAGEIFVVNGTISSKYNQLNTAAVWIHSGFGTSGTKVTGGSDTVNGYSYTLANSTIDYNTAFNEVSTGNYTYAISVTYTNYYAEGATTLKTNTGTKYLCDEYFVVVSSSTDQSTCSHSYTTTTIGGSSCTETTTVVKSCSKCGYITETTSTGSHSYGSWTTTTAATCTTDGVQTRTCSACGNKETKAIAASGHNYSSTTTEADCQNPAVTCYTCANCGDTYNVTEQSDWSTTKPTGVDESLIESKTQYRYSDYETTTSYETALSGYTLLTSAWEKSGSGTIKYVNSWPSGFSTSSSNYTTYNKKSSKKTASETTTAKTEINSDALVGYLWYHWCYTDSYYSMESKTGSYTTFHSFYSTTAPSDCADYDSSDGSYLNPDDCCSNGEWFWYVEVYAQKYTTYKKLFTYERWTDYTDWSDTAITASDTRKVETRTVYRYAELGDHNYVKCVCTVCGAEAEHSYVSTVVAPTCTAAGYTTHTCSACGHSYTDSEVASAGHSYQDVVTAPTCTADGYTTHTCSVCSHSYTDSEVAATGHTYVNGSCSGCGIAAPITDYYLFGYINGADYACEGDSANMGDYKFVNGKLTVTFTQDSYVAVKANDNLDWYMTNGWLGTNVTSATLYSTSVTGENSNKLYVPGGVEITFTLVVNSDNTLTLSYVAKDPNVDMLSASLSLGGNIGLNFYVALSDTLIADPNTRIVFTYDDKTQVIYLSDATATTLSGVSCYIFSCELWSTQMTKTVTAQVYNTDGPIGPSKDYSAKKYCDSLFNYVNVNGSATPDSYLRIVPLLKALLNYGTAAQVNYTSDTADQYANADLLDADKVLPTSCDVSGYAPKVSGSGDGIAVTGVSLVLDSTTSIRYFFSLTGSKAIDEYTFTVNGKEVKPVAYGSQYYVQMSGITANNLDTTYVASVGGLSVSYSALSYTYQVQKMSNPDANLLNLVIAMYVYNQEANEYYGS